MDDTEEARIYDEADFSRVNLCCARRISRLLDTERGHALDLGTGPAEIPIRLCARVLFGGLLRSWIITLPPRQVSRFTCRQKGRGS